MMEKLSVIYEPKGLALEYAKLALNIYRGCTHSCIYCYNNGRFGEKGDFFKGAKPRKGITGKLIADCRYLANKYGDDCPEILLTFLGDAYQPSESTLGYARLAFKTLIKFNLPFTVLTKSSLINRDIELLAPYPKFRLGLSFTSVACLTHIRSKPWIEQMFARAVRINKQAGPWEDQLAYIFAPDDILMREIIDEIEREQLRHVGGARFKKKILKKSDRKGKARITPIGSAATRQRQVILKTQSITPKQKEELLLREIEGHIRRFAFANRLEARQINKELYLQYGKPRRSMRYGELEKLLTHIKAEYPLGRPVRGTGIQRVPTQAQFVDGSEFDDSFIEVFEKLR